MTITYPLTFPTSKTANAIRLTPNNATEVSTSPFSFSQKSYSWGGERWILTGALPPLMREDAEQYMAFFTSLRGKFGTFLMRIPAHRTARGAVSGTVYVNGASQSGYTLNVDGLANSTTGIFKAGDFINLGSGASTRLHKILEDADSNGSGQAALSIWPALREAPADNAVVTYTDCVGHFRLTSEPDFEVDISKFFSISFTANEVV